MLASRSVIYRLNLGFAGALLGTSLALGAIPVLAAARPDGIPSSLAPVVAEPNTAAHPWVGAESQVNPSMLLQSGGRTWPAVSPSSPPALASGEKASSLTSGGAYTAMTPVRLLDTRTSGQTLGGDSSLNLTVAGGDGVPADATAVALNVTVTNTSDAGYLSVYPAGGPQPNVSNLNWTTGETVANSVIVPVGTDDQVTIYNHTGSTDVVVDLQGYFAQEVGSSTAGAYVPLTPARIADTRAASGYPYEGDTLGPALSLPDSLNVQVTGEDGIPAGATGAIVNVTVVNITASSYLTVYPEGAPQPTASNLNWTAGETVANRVLVSLSSTGMITLYNHAGNTDVVVDVNGYFTSGTSALPSNASLYAEITPARITDTRAGSGYPNEGDTLGAGGTLPVQVTGEGGIPADATAGVLNVTATDTTDGSYFTVYPTGSAMPTASDVNWTAGETVPNLTVATLSESGSVTVYNYAGNADLVVDAFGYFSPAVAGPLAVTTTSLPGATVEVAYSTTLTASGGTTPYSWEIISGTLPTGLSLSSGGVISGTPTAMGTSSFTVQVTDSTTPTPETATAPLSLTVAAPAALTITTTSLPNATDEIAYSTNLHASGGTTPYSWEITSGSLPVGLTLSSSGAISGTPSVVGSSSFTVEVTDSTTPTPETATAGLSLTVLPDESENWSGYTVQSGPYTAVSGTFVVPSLTSPEQANTYMSEWVGIDGVTNEDLIQAGIQETPVDVETGTFSVQAWWEILPAPETIINSLTVSPGDLVTVTIDKVSETEWDIQLTDNKTGTFSTEQPYSGPGTSAEWIVEAPEVNGEIAPLAKYAPDVKFSALATTGTENTFTEWVMVQNGVQVSTPSVLNSEGFYVAYGDVAPSPP
jgi:hypothetical protein